MVNVKKTKILPLLLLLRCGKKKKEGRIESLLGKKKREEVEGM